MAEQFNFDQFLMEKGFRFTNYGDHNLYEIAKDGHNYAVNLQGKVMTTNQSRTSEMLPDVAVPTDLKAAEKWHSEFFGEKAEAKAEPVAEKPEPAKAADKPKGRPAKK